MSKAATQTVVKERPIIFSGPMVRAILAGRKTMTRRVITPQPRPTHFKPCQGCKDGGDVVWHFFNTHLSANTDNRVCPYGKRGERLWVREAWFNEEVAPSHATQYRADMTDEELRDEQSVRRAAPSLSREYAAYRWRSPIHMPRWASRLLLRITDVRVERIQDISFEDVLAEGVTPVKGGPHANQYAREDTLINFARGWNRLNNARGFGWDKNPWVWCISFRPSPPPAAAPSN